MSIERNPTRRLSVWTMVGACALYWLPNSPLHAGTGQVLDASTRKPIAGAFVFATWHGQVSNPVDSKSKCYHLAITQSGSDGRYILPTKSGNVEPWIVDRHRTLDVYHPGYERSPQNNPDSSTVLLQPDSAKGTDRIRKIARRNLMNCVSESQAKALGPLYRAQYEEIQRLAQTPEDNQVVRTYKAKIDHAEHGYAEYMRRLEAGEYRK